MRGGAAFPVRLRYTKRGKIRWISHRDVARALERAFRITQLPLAFSEGFSPRPKVSFGLALSTGHESDAEYLDLVLAHETDLDALPALITDALPQGMAVTGAEPLVERAPALQEAVTSVVWLVAVSRDDGTPIAPSELATRAHEALACGELVTQRQRKGREVTEDIRPVIRRIDVVHGDEDDEHPAVEMELNTQPRSAKPTDVIAAMSAATAGQGGLMEVRALRTYQWIERDGARLEPLCADTRPRDAEARVS